MRLRGEYDVHSDEDRVKLIANLVEEGSQSPEIRKLTLGLLRKTGVAEKDSFGEINAIFNWVKRNIQYRGDIFCRDTFHKAERIIELRAGDCDDHTILLDSMLGSIGFPIGARIVSSRSDKPYHHIYALVGVKDSRFKSGLGWMPLDSTDKGYKVGQEPRWAKKKDYMFICGE